jgi:energy-converting hydrogenase Eha subunit A
MTKPRRESYTTAQIFAAPLAIGVITALGLTTALLGDGLWDWMSWAALALPVAVAVVYWQLGGRRAEQR